MPTRIQRLFLGPASVTPIMDRVRRGVDTQRKQVLRLDQVGDELTAVDDVGEDVNINDEDNSEDDVEYALPA